MRTPPEDALRFRKAGVGLAAEASAGAAAAAPRKDLRGILIMDVLLHGLQTRSMAAYTAMGGRYNSMASCSAVVRSGSGSGCSNKRIRAERYGPATRNEMSSPLARPRVIDQLQARCFAVGRFSQIRLARIAVEHSNQVVPVAEQHLRVEGCLERVVQIFDCQAALAAGAHRHTRVRVWDDRPLRGRARTFRRAADRHRARIPSPAGGAPEQADRRRHRRSPAVLTEKRAWFYPGCDRLLPPRCQVQQFTAREFVVVLEVG